MKRLHVFCLFLTLGCLVIAAENTVLTQIKGQGKTRDLAIQNALYLAVCQVQSVAVQSDVATADIHTGSLDSVRDYSTGSRKIDIDDISAKTAGTITTTEAKGLIKAFEIVEEQKLGDEQFEVTLKVWVYDYQGSEDTQKLRVAIFPFEAPNDTYSFGNISLTGKRLGEQFGQAMTIVLARNEKYTVLDRQTQAAILKEKQLLSSDDAPLEEKMRLGEALGADYMLTGTIGRAQIDMRETDNPAVGYPMREFHAYLDVEYRLVVGPTRQVAASDQLCIKLEDEQVKTLMKKWESDDIDFNEMEQTLIARAAGQIADFVSEILYPIRIAAIQENGMLILNRGGKSFAEGNIFDVCKIGQDVIDPETGKSLGKEETQLARIKIIKVLPRISYATVCQGSATEALKGGICRRVAMDEVMPELSGRKSDIQETPTGGVILPGDNRGPSQLIRTK